MYLGLGLGLRGGQVVASGSTPSNTVAPVASGTALVGATLSVTDGTWTNSPSSYTYQWKQAGVSIGGATANTYVVLNADQGFDITCTVTAINGSGSGNATSNAISIPASGSVGQYNFEDPNNSGLI